MEDKKMKVTGFGTIELSKENNIFCVLYAKKPLCVYTIHIFLVFLHNKQAIGLHF